MPFKQAHYRVTGLVGEVNRSLAIVAGSLLVQAHRIR